MEFCVDENLGGVRVGGDGEDSETVSGGVPPTGTPSSSRVAPEPIASDFEQLRGRTFRQAGKIGARNKNREPGKRQEEAGFRLPGALHGAQNSAKPAGGDIWENADRIARAGRAEIRSLWRRRSGERGDSWRKDRELQKVLRLKTRKTWGRDSGQVSWAWVCPRARRQGRAGARVDSAWRSAIPRWEHSLRFCRR